MLTFDQCAAWAQQQPQGQVTFTVQDTRLLWAAARWCVEALPITAIEYACAYGYSSLVVADALNGHGTIQTVDCAADRAQWAQDLLGSSATVHQGDVRHVCWAEKADLLVFDGGHDRSTTDWCLVNWFPRLRNTGLLFAHDMVPDFIEEQIKPILFWLEQHGWGFWFIWGTGVLTHPDALPNSCHGVRSTAMIAAPDRVILDRFVFSLYTLHEVTSC